MQVFSSSAISVGLLRNISFKASDYPKRKKIKIPSMGDQSKTTIADDVVAGVRWLSENGYKRAQILEFYPEAKASYQGFVEYTRRIHVNPKKPQKLIEMEMTYV